MTGGRVVVLGRTGRNFAAGMSGGIAYVFDPAGGFADLCNRELVDLDPIAAEDEAELHTLIQRHAAETGSTLAGRLLADWDAAARAFVKVMPRDYRRALIQSTASRDVVAPRYAELRVANG
jgi:glutamate synthase (NADPH/NADH) large chain